MIAAAPAGIAALPASRPAAVLTALIGIPYLATTPAGSPSNGLRWPRAPRPRSRPWWRVRLRWQPRALKPLPMCPLASARAPTCCLSRSGRKLAVACAGGIKFSDIFEYAKYEATNKTCPSGFKSINSGNSNAECLKLKARHVPAARGQLKCRGHMHDGLMLCTWIALLPAGPFSAFLAFPTSHLFRLAWRSPPPSWRPGATAPMSVARPRPTSECRKMP